MNKIKKVLLVLTIISLSFFSTCYALGKSEYGTFRTKALLPKGYGITLIEKLNNEEMFVEARNTNKKYEYFTCNIETENCLEFPKDNELKDYDIDSVFDTNVLLVYSKIEGYMKDGKEYGMPYTFDINTKKFKRINPEIMEGKWVLIDDKRFLRIEEEKKELFERPNYYICDFETQKCEYGGEFPAFEYFNHIMLNDNQILFTGTVCRIYNIKENKFGDHRLTYWDTWGFIYCGENFYCNLNIVDDYRTAINRYKLLDDKLEYIRSVSTGINFNEYGYFTFDVKRRIWLIYAGKHGLGNIQWFSKNIYAVDVKTGKTTKIHRLPFRDPDVEDMNDNKWIFYSGRDLTNKVVIFDVNKKFTEN